MDTGRIKISHNFIKDNIPYLIVPFMLKNKATGDLTNLDIGELFLKDEARPFRMAQNRNHYLMTFRDEDHLVNFCKEELPQYSGHIVGLSVQTSDIPMLVGGGDNQGYVINPTTDHILIKI